MRIGNAVETPGMAMRATLAVLRHHGYAADEVSSMEGRRQMFIVRGNLSKLDEDGRRLGLFVADVSGNGSIVIRAAAFGVIEEGQLDPFVGL